MATKTAAKTKTSAAKVKKVAPKKAKMAKIPLYKEKNPENHTISGKYKFFYCLFAVTAILFAALSVWLFVFSSQVLNKYESIEACARATANGTCNVSVQDSTSTTTTTTTTTEDTTTEE